MIAVPNMQCPETTTLSEVQIIQVHLFIRSLVFGGWEASEGSQIVASQHSEPVIMKQL